MANMELQIVRIKRKQTTNIFNMKKLKCDMQ